MLHDVRQSDSYIQHLMTLTEKYEVMTTEPVINQQGALIVPANVRLNSELAQRISTHKLEKPLETSLILNNGFNGRNLYQLYENCISEHDEFRLFHHHMGCEKILKEACDYYSKFNLLIQKITVLKECLPAVFEQTLFNAYVSMSIAKQLKFNTKECKKVFLAGLVHDIGLLHIDPKIMKKTGTFTSQEWQTMQSHTIIGYCILKYIAELPTCISKGVLEHHERCDGSGYPQGESSSNLGVVGQIIGMADTCISLYKRELLPRGMGGDALASILQLNPEIYSRKIYQATLAMIKTIPWKIKNNLQLHKVHGVITRLLVEQEAISHDYCVLYGMVTSLKQEKTLKSGAIDNTIHGVTQMGERLGRCLKASGILQREHEQWLVGASHTNDPQDRQVVVKTDLMYGEIKWQLRQLKRMLLIILKNHKFNDLEIKNLIHRGLLEIAQYHKLHDPGVRAVS